MLSSTVYAEKAALNSPPTLISAGISDYIFDQPSLLSHAVNVELATLLDSTKIRIVNGGILSQSDFDEWSRQMGKDKAVKYQQAFYSAFAGDNGPKSLTNIRVTDSSGQSMMNCIISHPNTDWHVTWATGGLNMSMQYGENDYNLNDVSEFILFHEGKHCFSKTVSPITNENLSDAFAALVYRWKHNGKTAMLKDILGFRLHQVESINSVEDPDFKQAALIHDTRTILQKVIDLNFETDIQGLSITELNTLADNIVSRHI
ncbi:MAG: hypothetical protein GQ547_04915, partial [Methylophaga sp.]|nr:hypothetical protein [Methylophaga sp.]